MLSTSFQKLMSNKIYKLLDICVYLHVGGFMKVSQRIASKVDTLPRGIVFNYLSMLQDVSEREAVIKALNRLAQAGKIAKLSRGKYYKPEVSPFGNLQPHLNEVVKDLLYAKGCVLGYVTGISIFNKLGLTTQVSNTIQIGKNEVRPSLKRERYTISFFKQRNRITKDNIELLQILDAVRLIKRIPDSTIENSVMRIISILGDLPEDRIKIMIKLSLKYPPMVRALLGAILEQLGYVELLDGLFNSLNPLTKYRYKGLNSVLSNTNKWNIA